MRRPMPVSRIMVMISSFCPAVILRSPAICAGCRGSSVWLVRAGMVLWIVGRGWLRKSCTARRGGAGFRR